MAACWFAVKLLDVTFATLRSAAPAKFEMRAKATDEAAAPPAASCDTKTAVDATPPPSSTTGAEAVPAAMKAPPRTSICASVEAKSTVTPAPMVSAPSASTPTRPVKLITEPAGHVTEPCTVCDKRTVTVVQSPATLSASPSLQAAAVRCSAVITSSAAAAAATRDGRGARMGPAAVQAQRRSRWRPRLQHRLKAEEPCTRPGRVRCPSLVAPQPSPPAQRDVRQAPGRRQGLACSAPHSLSCN